MKIISFFSGAGGMDLGFLMAGHEIVWSNDFDKYALETYKNNIGRLKNHFIVNDDIVEYLADSLNNINSKIPDGEMIIGGFPCQGFSIANVSRSMTDQRNFLYEQLLIAISVKKPDYFLLENVKGLESMQEGKVLSMILDDLESTGTIGSKFFPSSGPGYSVYYNVFNALDFGVPQNRERVIIIGIRNDIFTDTNEIRKFLTYPDTSKKRYDHRKILNIRGTHSKSSKLEQTISPIDISNLMYASLKKGIKAKFPLDSNKIYSHTNLSSVIADLPSEFDSTINNHVGSHCKVTIKNTVGNRATEWNRHAPTIMGRGSGTGGPLIPPHPNQLRRLSVRETARIQTFPDDFVFFGSNSAAYRQIGNAVPILFSYHLAKIFPY